MKNFLILFSVLQIVGCASGNRAFEKSMATEERSPASGSCRFELKGDEANENVIFFNENNVAIQNILFSRNTTAPVSMRSVRIAEEIATLRQNGYCSHIVRQHCQLKDVTRSQNALWNAGISIVLSTPLGSLAFDNHPNALSLQALSALQTAGLCQ